MTVQIRLPTADSHNSGWSWIRTVVSRDAVSQSGLRKLSRSCDCCRRCLKCNYKHLEPLWERIEHMKFFFWYQPAKSIWIFELHIECSGAVAWNDLEPILSSQPHSCTTFFIFYFYGCFILWICPRLFGMYLSKELLQIPFDWFTLKMVWCLPFRKSTLFPHRMHSVYKTNLFWWPWINSFPISYFHYFLFWNMG